MGSYLGKYSSRRDIHQAFTISIIKPVSSIQDIECRLLDSSSYTIHKRPVRSSVSLPATMPGFDFSNHTRNAALHSRGVPLPKATSTGTTIVGCIFDGGVVVRSAHLLLPFELQDSTQPCCHSSMDMYWGFEMNER